MKLFTAAALALFAATPALAANEFVVDFEKTWDYAQGDVNGYYAGGTAADGTSGVNLGVSFIGVSGLSNGDGLGTLPNGDYYANAPTGQGVAYAYGSALMNVAAGVEGGFGGGSGLTFFYSSPDAIVGAVKAYSGLNGTGTLLGTYDLTGNSAGGYTTWTQANFTFAGTAQSFDLSATANVAALDNIAAVPEPAGALLVTLGVAGLGLARRRRS